MGFVQDKFVNQQFLILIITKRWVQFKEQSDSCFTQLNEQAEKKKVYAASNKTAQPKSPEWSKVVFSTKQKFVKFP